jgi:hypothetical protein
MHKYETDAFEWPADDDMDRIVVVDMSHHPSAVYSSSRAAAFFILFFLLGFPADSSHARMFCLELV